MAYLREQREATRNLPDDRTVVVERFRDELGDWRMTVHCVLGARVNAPWALAIARRLSERYGVDGQVMPSDDGIVVRLPDTAEEPPGADLVAFDPEEIAQLVEESVGTSALFAARFRECAARSLLLPRRDPRRRQPLWQQRQRSAQLLDVAREFADFPVTLEAARECLQDVFDLPGLVGLMREIAGRKVRLVEVETPRPSPFARSLLFGYVGAFLYEGDAPLAERRAAALALDSTLLGELLGRVDLRELLDPAVVAETEAQLQWLTTQRAPRDAEDAAELLRLLGDLSEAALPAAARRPGVGGRRWRPRAGRCGCGSPARSAGSASRTPAATGTRSGWPCRSASPRRTSSRSPTRSVTWSPGTPARTARSRRPPARRTSGSGVFVVEQALKRLSATGRVVSGEFSPGGAGTEWCDAEVLRMLRRRSLAALRREIEPVPPRVLAAFLPRWHQIGGNARGVDAVAATVEQLQGVAVPASAWERLVLPARVADYSPPMLDELCGSGEVLWAGSGSVAGDDGWVTLAYADSAPLLLPAAGRRARADPAAPVGAGRAGRRAGVVLPVAVRPGRRHRRHRPGRRRVGPGLGRSPDQRHVRAAAGAARRRAAPTAPRRRRPAPGSAGPAARRCRPATARPRWPAAGPGCPTATSTRPGARPRWPTSCWNGTAW